MYFQLLEAVVVFVPCVKLMCIGLERDTAGGHLVYTSTNVISLFRFKLDFPNITNIYILTTSLRVGHLDHTPECDGAQNFK